MSRSRVARALEQGRAISWVVGLLLVASGCKWRSSDEIAVSVSDSSGVSIVQVPPLDVWPRAGAIGVEPVAIFGGAAAGELGEFVGGSYWFPIARLSDGSRIIGDRNRILSFRGDGSLAGVQGRSGEGPGEYRDIRTLCVIGRDSILVVDDGLRRATLIGSWGQAPAAVLATSREVPPGACNSNRGAVLIPGEREAGEVGSPPRAPFLLTSVTGETLAVYRRLPQPYYGEFEAEPSFSFLGDTLVVTDGWHPTVSIYGPGATLAREIRIRPTHERRAPGEQGAGAVESPASGSVGNKAGGKDTWRPEYSRMLVGSDGKIWLLTKRKRSADSEWHVMRGDGTPVGVVVVPGKLQARLLGVRGDTMVVVSEQADRPTEVREYLVTWSPNTTPAKRR